MKIDIIAGARPNFIKIAPIIAAIEKSNKNGSNLYYRLIHTGQHYDSNMSGSFFEQLQIPQPYCNLNAGGGSQAEQTAKIMIGYESLLIKEPCDICIVVGDVNSTMACAIVAKKLHIKVAHIEAGIRSYDLTMPEEINRLVTDSITDIFFTTTRLASDNLLRQGVAEGKIFLVGNTMIDTLLKFKDKFIQPKIWNEFNLKKKEFVLLTLHRPSNVDSQELLKEFLEEILNNTESRPIIFPVHPRTSKILEALNFNNNLIHFVPPMSYLEFNFLAMNAKVVITDSGGITEETTIMGVPCITLRDNTERPETITIGTNELIGTNPKSIKPVLAKLFSGYWKKGSVPPLWDGKTADRIIDELLKVSF